MTTFKKITAIAALMMSVAGISEAHATNMWVHNSSKNAIWITIYGNGFDGQKRDWFCLLPGTEQSSDKYNDTYFTNVYVRAEVKSETNTCNNHSNKYDINSTMLTLNDSGRAMVSYSSNNVGDYPSVNNTAWH